MGNVMKKFLSRIMLPLSMIAICAAANADSRIVEVWTCVLNDGQSMDGVKTGNGNWLKYVNSAVDGGGILSYVLTPVVGAQGTFMYVDSFPSAAAWIAAKEALLQEEGVAVEEALNVFSTCESNTLHTSEQS
jgi:hypothetical protein